MVNKRTKKIRRNFKFKLSFLDEQGNIKPLFIDGQGDSRIMKKIVKQAKKYQKNKNMIILDFNKVKNFCSSN